MSAFPRPFFFVMAAILIWRPTARPEEVPPTIQVCFQVAAEPFKSNLTSAQRTKVETDLAQKLAELCAESIAYLKWQPASTTASGPALKVSLREESANYGNEIFLQYVSVNGSQELNWPRDPAKTVYPAFELSLPSHNPEQLESDILKNIRADFGNDSFRRNMQERLATTIPIAHTMTFDSTTERCVLPLRWDALQAAGTSVLLARFKARAEQGDERPVQIRMAPERWDDEIKCRVFEFDYPPDNLKDEQLRDPNKRALIPKSLDNKVGDAAVYMESYVREFRANTSGKLNLSPRSAEAK